MSPGKAVSRRCRSIFPDEPIPGGRTVEHGSRQPPRADARWTFMPAWACFRCRCRAASSASRPWRSHPFRSTPCAPTAAEKSRWLPLPPSSSCAASVRPNVGPGSGRSSARRFGRKNRALLGRFKTSKLIYVSCDPATLSRDLRVLVESGFHIEEAHLVDLFPQTFHIETVFRLAR